MLLPLLSFALALTATPVDSQPAHDVTQDPKQAEFLAIQAADRAQCEEFVRQLTAMGPLASPRDTARAVIGTANVLVDYGRPSRRGREIFGGLVPFGERWRVGANAATVLVTDKDLDIGGTLLPAGQYTISAIPGESSWTLIINKEVGQLGLVYRPEYDFARVRMKVATTTAKTPVEKFLIDFSHGNLRFRWDTTIVQVAVAEHK